MTIQDINQQLYRPLLNGSQYDKYFSTSDCKPKYLGTGDTKIVLKQMKRWAKQHQHQTQDLADALINGNLIDTVDKIQWFLYHHFQYSIDESDQQLRSPGCAWATRQQGMDCKTYTIIGSCILLNLGIKHYLTRVKLNDPDAFTHVYITIPLDQNNPTLNRQSKFLDDYVIIDGTIEKNYEQEPLDKDNLYMEPNLPIYGLAMPSIYQPSAALGCGCGGDTSPLALNGFFDNFNTGNIFGGSWSPSCIGGTYDKRDLDYSTPIIIQGFDQLYEQFNQSLSGQNLQLIKAAINNILQYSKAFQDHTERTAGHDWSSRCSRDTTKAFKEMGLYFNNIATKAFFPYLNNYFTITTSFRTVANNSYPFNTRGSDGLKKNEFVTNVEVIAITNIDFKGNQNIPFFELTPYVIDNVDNPGFNINQFLNSLSNTAIQLLDPNSGNTNGNTNGGTIDNGTTTPLPTPPPPAQAGFGKVAGYAALAWLVYEGYKRVVKK